MSLKLKIIASQTLVVLLAVAASTTIAGWQSKRGFNRVAGETERGSKENADAVHEAMTSSADAGMVQQAKQVWTTCAAQDEMVNNTLKSYVSVAGEFVERAGGLALGSESVN